ncbi:MAG: ATP-dependent dethiobiotin synthetase BioD [Okeania sp. SIO2G4]|uniref:dethiobiotin synthase n=1 Tax=unclassified Okeania TaxID=2634635 RepID=UPI0013B79E91|nr:MULTISPECIES: dethiobiotin synthase [unclassified Okeania]NEP07925.1 ATP-dependent dethiobiotin synthetase BioD [Okeania sp. SIO4D6]NEP46467.1 ATP-dependent dethiobiotin synthetase BioD [Okeania sp. SIO2H7]NEP70420.1 ATP-dependent dethiobiotin synthetase BioD [Okeania sp. SIO2G5]NEP96173.1 ATP-dependent dethiobiotin synthetase BioD [Okeania sp. SIO2F5]NEQ93942.1 ATP-dependent dethiobiotin synthetase BioD [Okeania sp. SIO2G4]
MKELLITATDTDAGKTILTLALAAYWQTYHQDRNLGLFKPIQTGIGDRELYTQLFSLDQSLDEINSLWYETPVAPPVAAEREGRLVELDQVWSTFARLRQQKDFVLVEGLGGLGSPVTHELTVADIARDWHLPTILVVPIKLGAIAQTVANVALARQMKVNLRGIILNCVKPCSEQEIADWTPVELIQSLTQVQVCGIIPHLPEINNLDKLATAASNLDLEKFLPLPTTIKN